MYSIFTHAGSFSVAAGYGLDGEGIKVRSQAEAKVFSLLKNVQSFPGIHTASYLSSGTLTPGLKRLKH
jgi:hypothetical protein